jgi:hypothetical protein
MGRPLGGKYSLAGRHGEPGTDGGDAKPTLLRASVAPLKRHSVEPLEPLLRRSTRARRVMRNYRRWVGWAAGGGGVHHPQMQRRIREAEADLVAGRVETTRSAKAAQALLDARKGKPRRSPQ